MNKIIELNEENLKEVAGGVYTTPDVYPIGTKVIQNEFNQEVGRYSGEVTAVYKDENGEMRYDVLWSQGDKQYTQTGCTHAQIRSWNMAWDIEFGW